MTQLELPDNDDQPNNQMDLTRWAIVLLSYAAPVVLMVLGFVIFRAVGELAILIAEVYPATAWGLGSAAAFCATVAGFAVFGRFKGWLP